MARLASVEKGGFYPTPTKEVDLICSRLHAKEGDKINALDPCCGKGAALKKITDSFSGAEVTSYGVELEEGRAGIASEVLDHTICSDYQDAIITPLGFSYLHLNPPYESFGSQRAEIVFLRDLTDAYSGRLQPGGLMSYVIPEYILKDAATILAGRFRDICVYRFTKKNYPVYKQIVVFGYRSETRPSQDTYKNNKEWLCSLGVLEDIPSIDTLDGIAFSIPASRKEIETFKPAKPAREEIAAALAHSSLWRRAVEFLPRMKTSNMKAPVLPLKPPHIAIAIAAGAVGGAIGNHLLVGKTDKVTDVSVKHDDKGETTETRTERVVTIVRIFTQDDVHDLQAAN